MHIMVYMMIWYTSRLFIIYNNIWKEAFRLYNHRLAHQPQTCLSAAPWDEAYALTAPTKLEFSRMAVENISCARKQILAVEIINVPYFHFILNFLRDTVRNADWTDCLSKGSKRWGEDIACFNSLRAINQYEAQKRPTSFGWNSSSKSGSRAFNEASLTICVFRNVSLLPI